MVFSTIVNKLIEIQKKKKTHTILRKKKKNSGFGSNQYTTLCVYHEEKLHVVFFLVKNLCFPPVGQTYIYLFILLLLFPPLLPSSTIYVRNKQVVTQHRPRRIISRQRIFKPFCMWPVVRQIGRLRAKKKKKKKTRMRPNMLTAAQQANAYKHKRSRWANTHRTCTFLTCPIQAVASQFRTRCYVTVSFSLCVFVFV